MTAGPARVSLIRYSPALILFAIVIADARQHSDPDLWGHVLFGRQLLAHGVLPRENPYSYSAPGFPWLHHEWLSEVLMGALFDKLGTAGLKLLKFTCTTGTICFIAAAESETIAPALVQLSILLVAALLLMPERPRFLSRQRSLKLLMKLSMRRGASSSEFPGRFFSGVVVGGSVVATLPATVSAQSTAVKEPAVIGYPSMPALDFGLPLRFSPKPSASPSHYAVQQAATGGPRNLPNARQSPGLSQFILHFRSITKMTLILCG